MVIPKFFDAVLNDREIEIHGSGNQRRVFCHVADAVSGILAIWGCEEAKGEVFNVGGKEEIEISKLAEAIMKVVGKQVGIRNIPYEELRREGFEDMQRRVPSTEKLRKLTGWQPRRGLTEILEDFKKHLVGSK
jgi:UDP-glucose 4-epimerase